MMSIWAEFETLTCKIERLAHTICAISIAIENDKDNVEPYALSEPSSELKDLCFSLAALYLEDHDEEVAKSETDKSKDLLYSHFKSVDQSTQDAVLKLLKLCRTGGDAA